MAVIHISLFFIVVYVVQANDSCSFSGKTYAINEQFQFTPCQVCVCTLQSVVQCSHIACPPVPCVDSVKKNDTCCRICPNGPNCLYGDHLIRNGELYRIPNGEVCECPFVDPAAKNGQITRAICGKP